MDRFLQNYYENRGGRFGLARRAWSGWGVAPLKDAKYTKKPGVRLPLLFARGWTGFSVAGR
jgi:hypothetical protein